jgi:putative transport protein
MDMATVGIAMVIGALIGAIVIKVAGVPLTLSTAGGVLIAGLVFGWLRSVAPSFGRIRLDGLVHELRRPQRVHRRRRHLVRPGFVKGPEQLGIGLFLWGVAATTLPLVLGMFIGKYVFNSMTRLILGIASGRRTTTARLWASCATWRRARCQHSATRSPTLSATRCSPSGAW